MFEPLIEECKLRNYSQKTIEIYLRYNQEFLTFTHKKPQEITREDIRSYLLHCIEKQQSSSTINLAHNALNFYYCTILGRKFQDISFQKREQKVRSIPTKEEIQKMIYVTSNLKHKILIGLLYASGIRRSEAIKIQIADIDFDRKLLLIRQGKGAKYRYTILSGIIIHQIKEYFKNTIQHNSYLFSTPNGHITARTVEAIIHNAKHNAKITKHLSPHSLRHSFATHLMENGTKIEYIQQMLGHKDIRTTRIYQHISTSHLENIKSPHDI